MIGYRLILLIVFMLFPASGMAAGTYFFKPGEEVTGDVHIKNGDELSKRMIIKNGNLLIEGLYGGPCVVEGGSVTVKGSVNYGGILSYGGPVSVSGYASEVNSYRGTVEISGRVKDVNVIEAKVILASSAVVEGKVTFMSSKVLIAPGARINGQKQLREITRPPSSFFPNYHVTSRFTPNRETVPGFIAGMGLLLLVPVLFMRRSLEGAALGLRESFWKSAGSGIVVCGTIAIVGYVGLLSQIFSLCIPAIGMGAAALNIGCSIFFRTLGDKIFSLLGKTRPEPIIATTAGYLLAVLIGVSMLMFGTNWGNPKNLDIAMDALFVIISVMLLAAGIIGTGAFARITPSPFLRSASTVTE